MPRVVVQLLHLYLIARIVCCPCLTGQDIHDRSSRSLFAWGGATAGSPDGLGNPEDRDLGSGPCMCDGASTPGCPECPPADRVGVALDDPGQPALVSSIGLNGLAPDQAAQPPRPAPRRVDARIVRAQLQNFRC